MNVYKALKDAQQKRVNALPIIYAFSDKQFEEGMKKLGLNPDDTDKIYSIGAGGFIRKEDASLIDKTFREIAQEMDDAIAADKDGTGFIYDMFLYELENHEFAYTGDAEPALDALGLSVQDVMGDPALLYGFGKAVSKAIQNAEED